jgi:SAM-dependent methyltransferase
MRIYFEDWLAVLKEVRQREIEQVVRLLRHFGGKTILEIGSGAGWQAQYLHDNGFDVAAVDLASTEYGSQQVFPVAVYDGFTIPLMNRSVDVVFSSNVLEHIPHVAAFQLEIQRVLKPHGYAIHLMPTTAWSLWSSISYYPFIAGLLWRVVTGRADVSAQSGSGCMASKGSRNVQISRSQPVIQRMCRRLFPFTHGVKGSFLTEPYYFSEKRWISLLKHAGWHIEAVQPNRLFYTGYMVGGRRLSVQVRERLSRVLGSAGKIYVMRQARHANNK